MDKHLVHGILWTAAAKWSSQIVSWGSLVIITHFVSPADFGLVTMANLYLMFARIVSQFGLGSATITLRDLAEQDIRQINAFSVLAGIVMFLLSCAVARPLGAFFRSPHLPAVVAVMSVTVLLAGVQTIPFSLLQRDFRFKLLSGIQAASTLVTALFTLVLAYLGYGYWALVNGILAGAMLSAALPICYAPRGFAWPRLKSIHHALKFSWEVLVSYLSWAFYTDADFLVAGRVLGARVLGEYSLSWNVASLPVEKVTTLVGQVTPAVFSARQTDYAELCRYVLLLTEGLSVITFPMGVGLALTAREAVPLLFGKVWVGAVVPLQILAVLGCARSVSALMSPLLTAVRNTRYLMLVNLSAALLMPCAFYLGSHWGAAGIAAAWIFGFPIMLLALFGRAFRRIGLSAGNYFKALRPAMSGAVAMAIAVEIIRLAALPGRPAWIGLLVEVAVGAAAYCGWLLLMHRDRVRAVAQLYRRMRGPAAIAVQ
ncbi:MAG: lipopolysaccharide biosynthesis protein [Steroidobacteraceae bacterium]